jgi:nucleotidyltransferase/DNA polymerase involved in DNA repair
MIYYTKGIDKLNKLCILDAHTLGEDADLSIFHKFGHLSIYNATGPDQVVQRIKDQDIIITNKVLLNESNLQLAPEVKLICITATGTNNVDLEYCRKRNITVTNVVAYSTQSVVQHTFALLFYLLESLPYYDQYVKSKRYTGSGNFTCLEKLIAQFAAELCKKLRREKLVAASITIKLRYSNFKTITRSKTTTPCNSDVIVTQIACELLHLSYNNKQPLRLFGLALGNLSPTVELEQGSLFEPQIGADYKNIDRLMDEIRERFGPEAINRANLLTND